MIYISGWMYETVDAGTWAISVNASQLRNGFLYNTSGDDQDAVSFKRYMPVGTYTCKILSLTNTNQGIMKVKIDSATVVTSDRYAALAFNDVITQTSISIASSGIKTIQIMVDGKNGSSSGYDIAISELVFYRSS